MHIISKKTTFEKIVVLFKCNSLKHKYLMYWRKNKEIDENFNHINCGF